jgi:hypothetical protein
MSLSSVGNPAWETIRGVRFAMLCGPTLVAILVTHAALDDIERAPPGMGGRLACFNKHRDALELAASAKHQRGQHDESGAVIVDAGDLRLRVRELSTVSTSNGQRRKKVKRMWRDCRHATTAPLPAVAGYRSRLSERSRSRCAMRCPSGTHDPTYCPFNQIGSQR